MSEIASPDDRLPLGLEIRRSHDAQGVVLALQGELDLASAPEVERQLDEIQREAGRQDRSISWIVQQAWKVARADIRRLPSPNDVLPTAAASGIKPP